jgi:hypothetical protein
VVHHLRSEVTVAVVKGDWLAELDDFRSITA